jgi:hypothetical protein
MLAKRTGGTFHGMIMLMGRFLQIEKKGGEVNG